MDPRKIRCPGRDSFKGDIGAARDNLATPDTSSHPLSLARAHVYAKEESFPSARNRNARSSVRTVNRT